MGLKLSDLLEKALKLEKYDLESASKGLITYMDEIDSIYNNLSYIDTSENIEITNELKNLLNTYKKSVGHINQHLKKLVYSNSELFIKSGEQIYKENLEKMLFNEHLEWSKKWPPNTLECEKFLNKISQHTNWYYPGLIFGAKDHQIIDSVKHCEPFYILERYNEYFNLQKEKFPADTSRKFRCYNINEINYVPKNAIGTIIVFNEFPFLPWEIVCILLNKFVECLSPGGYLIFNYNNCYTLRGFREFEDKSMTYTTPKMYINLLSQKNMFLMENYISDLEPFSYMIFQKGGNKNYIKKYPNVGFVNPQPTFNHPTHDKRLELIRKLSSD